MKLVYFSYPLTSAAIPYSQWSEDKKKRVREWYREDRKNNPEKYREFERNWRKNNPEKVKEHNRKAENRLARKIYKRQHSLMVNGKRIRVDKRPYSGICELCSKIITGRCSWHHWNDKEPNKGMWLCRKCHFTVEEYEHYLMNKKIVRSYLTLKDRIEKRELN